MPLVSQFRYRLHIPRAVALAGGVLLRTSSLSHHLILHLTTRVHLSTVGAGRAERGPRSSSVRVRPLLLRGSAGAARAAAARGPAGALQSAGGAGLGAAGETAPAAALLSGQAR